MLANFKRPHLYLLTCTEIGGVVTAVGEGVTKHQVGDTVGVGCFVDSCRTCNLCKCGEQNYCRTGMVGTYNSKEKYPHCPGYGADGTAAAPTYGGYSKDIVVHEDYVCKIPSHLDLAAATPLLCAGITVYSPMAHYGLKKGQRLAVAGLGGLGHMAVKFGLAWGCPVTVLSRGASKKEEAVSRLGATAFIDVTDAAAVKAAAESFDMIIDCIPAEHDLGLYLGMLDINGTMAVVGASPTPLPVHLFSLIARRKSLVGSMIGGMKETQEMLDFCGKHNIVCDIEMIDAKAINEAYERTIKSDVRYRFVIDTATL